MANKIIEVDFFYNLRLIKYIRGKYNTPACMAPRCYTLVLYFFMVSLHTSTIKYTMQDDPWIA